ncbi:MAG: Gfo/Idh/MocA family oxidoreductase, partial [Blautia sp.]|nr:Gfo/Idh/MocA family oxidoreductase [Blautia sp.]
MKIGILGCGVISNFYIQEIKRLYSTLMEITAVADLDTDRAKRTADKFYIVHAYTVEELLADQETELIINLTPPAVHTEINRKILQAGKHVFCEKPF